MEKNVLVGQCGGPTSVANASLAGILETALKMNCEHVYGMANGIQGLLEGKVIELEDELSSAMDIELLKRTPSSYLGSCRYMLPETYEAPESYQKIFSELERLNIGIFLMVGGTDAIDTVRKLSAYGRQIHSEVRFICVPMTVDNDVALTDHTAGYGSAAKYVAVTMKEIIRDAAVYDMPMVTIVQVMGRNTGWLTAAAALARGDDCEGVDLICLPELPFHPDRFIAKVKTMMESKKSIVVAVSEGVRTSDGQYVCELSGEEKLVDAFGHMDLSGTAQYLCRIVREQLQVKTRAIELSTLQRCAGHLTSRVDITEAYQLGGAAVRAGFDGHTGEMVATLRTSDDPYICATEMVDVAEVINRERKVPSEWVNSYKTDMTSAFIAYAKPLIQAELTPIYIGGLPRHIIREA
ncbi:MAG: 6-phosphofructokinase [Clostridia bacterium]|nr:6-phosphofructokinase [Clostridia bacterium]